MMRTAVAILTLSGVLAMNPSGCTGGGPMPGQDEGAGCLVSGRAENSKNQWYIEVTCDRDDGSGLDKSTPLLPNNDARAWPACTMNAPWPDCKNG